MTAFRLASALGKAAGVVLMVMGMATVLGIRPLVAFVSDGAFGLLLTVAAASVSVAAGVMLWKGRLGAGVRSIIVLWFLLVVAKDDPGTVLVVNRWTISTLTLTLLLFVVDAARDWTVKQPQRGESGDGPFGKT